MVARDLKAEVEGITWYHEFDFGDGLAARSHGTWADMHRRLWRFMERQLQGIDFRGKSVLDVGCWDGYWSFFAERQGAASVLATDDASQNWSDGRGLRLAKELLGSRAEIRQDLSVYELASLRRTFDIVMCLGVYYHLHDPFLAFAQLRHCCHPGSIVLLEGEVGVAGMHPQEARYRFRDQSLKTLLSESLLDEMLMAAYLRVQSRAHTWSDATDVASKLRVVPITVRWFATRLRRAEAPWKTPRQDRVFLVCRPFEGVNDRHFYPPPFGLKRYDDRFRTA
jgi:tRNA (mo5U34)-methyltransferase